MRIALLECFAGIAGDMFVAAAVDAGVPWAEIEQAVAALQLGVTLRASTVDRSGIAATRFEVLVDGEAAEAAEQASGHTHAHPHEHAHAHAHSHLHDHLHSHPHDAEPAHTPQPGLTHGRSLAGIRRLIAAAPLAPGVAQRALQIFTLLGAAEASIHNVPEDTIHFHEVGSVDAIADIVAASAAIEFLEREGPLLWQVSPINVGGGMVHCAHGTFPVPAPATASLLRGLPTYSAHLQKELTTPTGAAILRSLQPQPPSGPVAFHAIGYGAGTRNPSGFPNVLRLSLGHATGQPDTVVVMEAALDDLNPQLLAHAAQQLLAAGALDTMLTPVLMKKGRAGTLLTVLAQPQDAARLEAIIFRETSTLGLRTRQEQRRVLARHHQTVPTVYGPIRIKLGLLGADVVNAAPEFEDCRAAAEAHGVPLKIVHQAAVAAWAATSPSAQSPRDDSGPSPEVAS